MDDEELYDEFGNYIGPELDSDDDSEDEQVQLTPPRVHTPTVLSETLRAFCAFCLPMTPLPCTHLGCL